jgi:hypothetical protein
MVEVDDNQREQVQGCRIKACDMQIIMKEVIGEDEDEDRCLALGCRVFVFLEEMTEVPLMSKRYLVQYTRYWLHIGAS